MYFNGPCLTCIQNFSHFTNCEGVENVSLLNACIEVANTSCVIYSGNSYPCASIVSGNNLNHVLDVLATTFEDCPTCHINHNFVNTCGTDWKLTYNNNNYTATWYFKNKELNIYQVIPSSLIVTSQVLGIFNSTDYVEEIKIENLIALLTSQFKNANEFKIELTAPSCSPIVITWQTDATNCELLEPCSNSIADFAKIEGQVSPVFINVQSASFYSELYIDWLSCYYLKNTDSKLCILADYQEIYRDNRAAYLNAQNIHAIAKASGRSSVEPIAPLPSVNDFEYYGNIVAIDNNVNYNKMPMFIGCGCNVNNTHFSIVFRESVQSISDLATLPPGYLGLCVIIEDLSETYTWNPETNTWVHSEMFLQLSGHQFYLNKNPSLMLSSFDDCLIERRVKRDFYITNMNSMFLGWRPFSFGSFMVPYYFAKRHLEESLKPYTYSCGCGATE